MTDSTTKKYDNYTDDEKIAYYEQLALDPKTPERKRSFAIKRRFELLSKRDKKQLTKQDRKIYRHVSKITSNKTEMERMIAVSRAAWLED